MKRLLPVLLGIMLVLTVAVAAETKPIQFPVDETGAFDVSYEGTPGALYALAVVAGEGLDPQNPVITEDNVQFIDQKTADSEGNVNFDNVLLKDADKKSYVYLGGTDLNKAVLLGTVNEDLFINVKVGDIIYLQNGKKVVSEATEYELENTNGYVVVNTVDANGVQTSQKVYKVENSTVTEVENFKNGAVNTVNASIKVGEPSKTGLRTETKFATSLKNNVKQAGFIATIESPKVKKIMRQNEINPDAYELTFELEKIGAASSAAAYDKAKGLDKYEEIDSYGFKTVYCVVTKEGGIELNANNVLYNIVVRPYYILEDDTVIYGETTKNTIYDVADSIKKTDPITYKLYKDYIDSVLATIAGDAVIPGTELFKPLAK